MDNCYWCGKPLEKTEYDNAFYCSEECKIKKQFWNDNYREREIDKHTRIPDEIYEFSPLWREEMKELQYTLNRKVDHPMHSFGNECTIDLRCCKDKIKVTPEEEKILGALSQSQIDREDGTVTIDREDYR